ncbi:MAG: aspartyl protease family protein [Pyrinomonadaceae bacterium]
MKTSALIYCIAVAAIVTFASGPSAFAQRPQTETRNAVEMVPAKVAFENAVTVPMELYGGKPTVEIKINGKGPFRLFLDTGAGVTVLDQALARELALKKDGTMKVGDPTDPQGIEADRSIIDKLEIGSAVFSDFFALSWDRSTLYTTGAPRGVLGMPLFRKLLLTIDYPGGKVSIDRGSLKKGGNVIEFQAGMGGSFSLPLTIGREVYPASLDSGSPGGITFPAEFMKKLSLDGEPKEVGRARTVGGEAVVYGGKLKGTVTFAGHEFDQPDVAFFERLQHANIGSRILSAFAITIDQQNMLMRFAKAAGETRTAAVSPGKNSGGEFAGLYGVRRITQENGDLFLQRLSGPQGGGPKIKLSEASKDTYSIEGIPGPRVKFVRSADGKVIELQILNPAGEWETAKREN